jgi:hypothetical protein
MARRAAHPTSRQPAAPPPNRDDPHIQPAAHAPLLFRIHASAAPVLSAMQPSTQLVHVFSAPAGYLTRYYPEPAFAGKSTSIHWSLQAPIR